MLNASSYFHFKKCIKKIDSRILINVDKCKFGSKLNNINVLNTELSHNQYSM